jgi:hypothetical protein
VIRSSWRLTISSSGVTGGSRSIRASGGGSSRSTPWVLLVTRNTPWISLTSSITRR